MSKNVVSTKKMKVVISTSSVTKEFKKSFGYKKRYQTEKRALNKLSGLDGIPKVISFSDESKTLKITRLDGDPASEFSDKALLDLKSKILATIRLGVARHSLPVRDIIIDKNQNVGIVDFERATIKEDSWSIIWRVATLVTRFHLYRLIFKHNPDLLTADELKQLRQGLFIRRIFNFYAEIRDFIRNSYRDLLKIEPK